MSTRAVLLDIEGTLVDSNYFHAVAWWRACRRVGQVVPMASLHRLVGMGGDMVTKTIFGSERPDVAALEREEYSAFTPELVALPGAGELLRRITRAGLTPVLASSAPEGDLPRLLEVIGPSTEHLAACATSGDADKTKPEPDIFCAALAKVHAEPEDSLVIGDTKWDIEAARKAGMQCIGLQSGGWSTAELNDAGAVAVYNDAADLLTHFDSSPLAALTHSVSAW